MVQISKLTKGELAITGFKNRSIASRFMKQILNKKMDLSNINSKYLNNQENKVIYSNYLTKSSRSFLGY